MRSFTEIHTDIEAATARNNVEALAEAIRSKARGLVCRERGDLHEAVAQYRRALGAFNRALEIFLERDDAIGIGDTNGDIAKLYASAGDYPEALEYYNRALEAYQRLEDSVHSAWMLSNIGMLYVELNEHQKGLEYLDRSHAIMSQHGDRNREARAIGNMGMVYHAMGDHQRAVEICRRSVSTMREIGQPPEVQMHLMMFCTALTGAQLADEARSVLTELETTEAVSPTQRKYLDSSTAEVEELEGDLDGAHTSYRRALELAQKRTDFEGYIHHNTEYQRFNEEILGKGAVQRIALVDAERQMRAEREERERERAVLYSTLLCFARQGNGEWGTRNGEREMQNDHEQRVASVALAMQQAQFFWPTGSPGESREAIQFRIGIHSGPVTSGVIGTERLQYDVWGDAVNVASRMESSGEPGRIHVSSDFALALNDAMAKERKGETAKGHKGETGVIPSDSEEQGAWHLALRGETELKGIGTMTTYWLERST